MHHGGPQAIDIGVRIVNLIDTGSRESTYKLAALLALCQHATEHFQHDVGLGLPVALEDLADRVIALYWRQREPFPRSGRALRQVSRGNPQILEPVDALRAEAMIAFDSPALWRAPSLPAYPRARRRVAAVLAQMPLTHLQRSERGRSRDPFLYDDAALHKKMTVAELDAIDWSITLRPGVARVLAELSPLLTPLIEIAWVGEVGRFNEGFSEGAELQQHLFGLSRTALDVVRDPLVDAQHGRCFYCGEALWSTHVDHVLPWSRTGLDDLMNLVASDARCNIDKSDSLPVAAHIARAAARNELAAIAADIDWPLGGQRMLGTARAMLSIAPLGIRLWAGRGRLQELTPQRRREALVLLGERSGR